MSTLEQAITTFLGGTQSAKVEVQLNYVNVAIAIAIAAGIIGAIAILVYIAKKQIG